MSPQLQAPPIRTPLSAAAPQSTAVKEWYYFFENAGLEINRHEAAILELTAELEALTDLVNGLFVVTDQTLTAASTTINHPASGEDWTVILRQDATGGRAVVWGAGIKAVSAGIDTTASTVSVFRFKRSGVDWYMTGQPTTGMTP